MMRISSLLVAAALAFAARDAHADHRPEDNWDGVAAAFVVVGAIELAPVALLTVDLIAKPQSKVYGGFELAVGGSVALLNTLVALDLDRTPNCPGCQDMLPYFAGVVAIDLAAAAHGAYLLLREEPPPALELGTARGRFSPTVVSDGKASAPGLGLVGTF